MAMEYQSPKEYHSPAAQAPNIQGPPPKLPPEISQPLVEPSTKGGIQVLRKTCERGLLEYKALQAQGGAGSDRARAMRGAVVGDLRYLRSEVGALLKKGVARRWRKWLLGGIIATIIPAVRKILGRSSGGESRSSSSSSPNSTEHAFKKSKSLITRILDSVESLHGKSGIASVAFFVLAILYLFQSEVSVRVARTITKRLKKVIWKIESGFEEVTEQDLKVLNGWRWRVLLW
ncbi:hypothetical protein GGR50DRAFT_566433 [Xylaria sp. CBS 124048]|nr:hypothetical protein GGR50DRAFT_566433 [Xylaria sp. CBS 124048]